MKPFDRNEVPRRVPFARVAARALVALLIGLSARGAEAASPGWGGHLFPAFQARGPAFQERNERAMRRAERGQRMQQNEQRRAEAAQRRVDPIAVPPPPVAPVEVDRGGRPGRLTPDERRALRQQINDARRDVYRPPGRP